MDFEKFYVIRFIFYFYSNIREINPDLKNERTGEPLSAWLVINKENYKKKRLADFKRVEFISGLSEPTCSLFRFFLLSSQLDRHDLGNFRSRRKIDGKTLLANNFSPVSFPLEILFFFPIDPGTKFFGVELFTFFKILVHPNWRLLIFRKYCWLLARKRLNQLSNFPFEIWLKKLCDFFLFFEDSILRILFRMFETGLCGEKLFKNLISLRFTGFSKFTPERRS